MPPDTKIMMATEPADVAAIALIEAVHAIGDGQKHVVETLKGIHDEQRDDRKLMLDMRDRLVRIESNQVDRRVTDLEGEMAKFRAEQTEEKGFKAALFAVWKYSPTALGYIIAIIAAVLVYLRATGRFQ